MLKVCWNGKSRGRQHPSVLLEISGCPGLTAGLVEGEAARPPDVWLDGHPTTDGPGPPSAAFSVAPLALIIASAHPTVPLPFVDVTGPAIEYVAPLTHMKCSYRSNTIVKCSYLSSKIMNHRPHFRLHAGQNPIEL
jgi:hypothetical protein